MEYKLIDGLPTSPYGTTVAKSCKWCRKTMFPRQVGDKDGFGASMFSKGLFCSEECKQDERDWKLLQKPPKKYYTPNPKDKKEYDKQRYLKHKKEGRLLIQTNPTLQRWRVKQSREKKKLLSVSTVKSQ